MLRFIYLSALIVFALSEVPGMGDLETAGKDDATHRTHIRDIEFWGHHYGGNHEDFLSDMDVRDDGVIAICGSTSSSDLPVPGGYQTTNAGSGDAFVATFDADGTLRWATYLGGEDRDFASAVCFDSNGNLCVAGATESVSFPVRNPAQGQLAGDADLFIAKYSIEGDFLWSTYLGGTDRELMGQNELWGDITVDGQDNIIISACSESLDFPVKNAWQETNPGDEINILARFSANGTLEWATYLGGKKTAWSSSAGDVGTDADGNIYFAAQVSSTDMPVARAFQESLSGPTDMYISKWTPQGQLIWGTYFGGNGDETAEAVVVGRSGECIVVGSTASRNMPTRNPWQGEKANLDDGAIVCFDSTGALSYATFLGGDHDDWISAVDCNTNGDIALAGGTQSMDFPLIDGIDSSMSGRSEGFICLLDRESAGRYRLAWSTYFGGELGERWGAIRYTPNGSFCFAGYTQGDLRKEYDWFTGTRHNGYDYEGFLVNISGVITSVRTIEPAAPDVVTMSAIWPQPARNEIAISFTLPREGFIRFDLYDLTGRHVARLQSGAWYYSGTHTRHLRLPGLAPGMYRLQLRHGKVSASRSIIIR